MPSFISSSFISLQQKVTQLFAGIFYVSHSIFFLQPFFIRKRGVFRPGKAVKGLGGGVAALRRTTNPEDLRRQGGKEPFLICSWSPGSPGWSSSLTAYQ